MKVCRKCKILKPLSEFHKNKQNKDGLANTCKVCIREDPDLARKKRECTRKWQSENRDKDLERKRKYQVENRVKCLESRRKCYAENRDRYLEYQKRWRAENGAVRAYNMTHRKLIRPDYCSICRKICKPHGHHEDYEQPLQVIWVCPACHHQIHLKIN